MSFYYHGWGGWSFYNNEPYNPISYTRDVNKVSIVPPKGDHAYDVLHAVPFVESQTTPPRSLCKPELRYENYLTELERSNDNYCITSKSDEPNASRSLSTMLSLAYNLADTVVTGYDHTRKYQSPYDQTNNHADYPLKMRGQRVLDNNDVFNNLPHCTDITWYQYSWLKQSSQIEPSMRQPVLNDRRRSQSPRLTSHACRDS